LHGIHFEIIALIISKVHATYKQVALFEAQALRAGGHGVLDTNFKILGYEDTLRWDLEASPQFGILIPVPLLLMIGYWLEPSSLRACRLEGRILVSGKRNIGLLAKFRLTGK
jgi:hypothetical protein